MQRPISGTDTVVEYTTPKILVVSLIYMYVTAVLNLYLYCSETFIHSFIF